MNYLAHLFLAGDDPDAMLGNLMGDFVKGTPSATLPLGVRQGIILHRRIDAFTDSHPLTQRSIARISPRWGWFSGIIIDVYYDHLLACDWDRYAAVPLRAFVDQVYALLRDTLERRPHLLPEPMRQAVVRLIAEDRLASYARLEGVSLTLARLTHKLQQRVRRPIPPLEQAVKDLEQQRAQLQSDFDQFFPELIAYTLEHRSEAV